MEAVRSFDATHNRNLRELNHLQSTLADLTRVLAASRAFTPGREDSLIRFGGQGERWQSSAVRLAQTETAPDRIRWRPPRRYAFRQRAGRVHPPGRRRRRSRTKTCSTTSPRMTRMRTMRPTPIPRIERDTKMEEEIEQEKIHADRKADRGRPGARARAWTRCACICATSAAIRCLTGEEELELAQTDRRRQGRPKSGWNPATVTDPDSIYELEQIDCHRQGSAQQAGAQQPAPGRQRRQALHRPRSQLPGPDPGRQHGPAARRGQVRPHAGLQVQHLCHLVDSPGHQPRHRRPGAHHPHSRAHGGDHQPPGARQAATAAGAWTASRPSRKSRWKWSSWSRPSADAIRAAWTRRTAAGPGAGARAGARVRQGAPHPAPEPGAAEPEYAGRPGGKQLPGRLHRGRQPARSGGFGQPPPASRSR